MIHFKALSYKNFLSTGNAGTTILLDRSQTTLVQGPSGAGKSTMIDALCFGLYGKAFRDISKAMLVNSVNRKNCEVTVEFAIGNKEYKISRGIKPTKFEIMCDGVLMTQDAALRDYQKVLEQQVLMMSFKTFTQIVILGSTAYIPFMQLNPPSRREVIEDILDIGIFSTMNTLLKQQALENKEQQADTDTEIKALKIRAEGLKRIIEVLNSKNDEEIAATNASLATVERELALLNTELAAKQKENTELANKTVKMKELISASNKLLEKITLADHILSAHTKSLEFFKTNDSCPACLQEMRAEHKRAQVNDLLISVEAADEKVTHFRSMRDQVKDKINELQAYVETMVDNNNRIGQLNTSITLTQERQTELLMKLATSASQSSDVETPRAELKEVARNVIAQVDRKKELAVQRQLQEGAAVLLRDSGIKTAIINEYLPLINRFLGKYLADLQMDLDFHFDDQFNEVVKSRHRDEFKYGNFSEGEKLRIDISILLTWRHIAKLKNSSSCNLLIVDEVLSGRLDISNQDVVVEILNQLAAEGTNIFIISHGDSLHDKFRSGINFVKQGDFSVML